MARKETNPLIHCDACGEDYSATYRRCPYCGNKTVSREAYTDRDADDTFETSVREERSSVRSAAGARSTEDNRAAVRQGGRRLAGTTAGATGATRTSASGASRSAATGRSSSGTTRSGGSRSGNPVPQGRSAPPRSRAPRPKRSAFWEFWDRVGISPVRVVGFLFTLIVIIAVFLLVTKLVLPAINRGSVDTPNNKKPTQSQAAEPSPSVTPSTKPVEKDPEPTNTIPEEQTAVDFTINHTEFTISAQWPNPIKLEVTLLPAGSKGTVTFSSSNPDAVDVTADGTVWATGKGSATITATLPGAEPKTCKVISTVAGGVPPATPDPAPGAGTAPVTSAAPSGNLKLSITEFSISPQWPNPVTIEARGASGTVTWTSSDSSVARVDQNGKVSKTGAGKCIITATDSAGNSATCLVRCS